MNEYYNTRILSSTSKEGSAAYLAFIVRYEYCKWCAACIAASVTVCKGWQRCLRIEHSEHCRTMAPEEISIITCRLLPKPWKLDRRFYCYCFRDGTV